MLLSGKDLLAVANENSFAVPAFNVSDYAMLKGLVEVSEETEAPLLVAIHPDELSHVGTAFIPAVIAWAHQTSVPVAIHLDHGATLDQVLTAIQAGFTSVMIDGSLLPFEENVAVTREVVRVAHAVGVSVEGELGTIGQLDEQAEKGASEIIYTDPDDADRFLEQSRSPSSSTAAPATRTPRSPAPSSAASTRSTSPATSSPRTTRPTARCSPIPSSASPTSSSPSPCRR